MGEKENKSVFLNIE